MAGFISLSTLAVGASISFLDLKFVEISWGFIFIIFPLIYHCASRRHTTGMLATGHVASNFLISMPIGVLIMTKAGDGFNRLAHTTIGNDLCHTGYHALTSSMVFLMLLGIAMKFMLTSNSNLFKKDKLVWIVPTVLFCGTIQMGVWNLAAIHASSGTMAGFFLTCFGSFGILALAL